MARLGPGEWPAATTREFTASLPPGEGNGNTAATLYTMNDGVNMYLAVRVERSTLGSSSVSFEFDNDNNGVRSNGDDILLINPGLSPQFRDEVRTNEPPCPPTSLCGFEDTTVGGIIDGQGIGTNNGLISFYEMSHPLDSSDDL